ncbi:TetR family transcriptional regulator [Planctomonas sp. JC2975]|uniref:TetR/AcrR family transcriptional regulator n=1 Tax=Planctomonas sp. JC2975 TaxID=2729626 RepID=UPI001472C3D5|nr:TetR/AcrR family transcriptional regulator [Planctomonas sp. JC2975]NNC13574.1 TetR family transcriptional regulator [Planctomonas sp. JC2975]
MSTTFEDRRVRRSKTLIIGAFADLVLEKDYARVTVQDIIDRADVGRSTFYAHFRDKEAVLRACFDEVEAELATIGGTPADGTADAEPHDPSAAPRAVGEGASSAARVLMDHAWEHRQVYRAICASSASGIVQRHLRRLLLPGLRGLPGPAARTTDAAITREFYVSALIGVLIWWVTTDFHALPSEVADDFQRLAAGGIPGMGGSAA